MRSGDLYAKSAALQKSRLILVAGQEVFLYKFMISKIEKSGYWISRIALAVICAFTLVTGNPARASNDAQALSKLEDKFFDHDYSQDDEATRLNRLEQFIFGSAQSGSPADRLTKLQATVTANEPSEPT